MFRVLCCLLFVVFAYHSPSEPPHVSAGLPLGIVHLAVELCCEKRTEKIANPLILVQQKKKKILNTFQNLE